MLAPSRTFARSILGTVGEATKEIVDDSDGAVVAGDQVGLSGLQKRYDTTLRGTPGVQVRLLPLTRPALPWTRGAILFRSPDGKLLPFQSGSELQTAWITLYAGTLGSGKSLTMHHDNLAYLLGGERAVPYLSIIEPGASSQGLIELCRADRPPERQHEFIFRRLQHRAADAINRNRPLQAVWTI